LDKGWDGKGMEGAGREGSRHIVKYLLKNLGDESEGIIILNYILKFKNPKYSINKNSL
jgi:hypothetical protein